VVLMREHSRTFRLVTEVPEQRPEGALIEAAREAIQPRLSGRAAAAAAGISDGRWRQIVNGYLSAGRQQYIPVVAPPDTLARMAKVVGVTAEQLVGVGREDAAGELLRLQTEPTGSHPVGTGSDPVDLTDLTPEEIEAVKAVIRAMRSGRGD
jgi:hypothetical protein